MVGLRTINRTAVFAWSPGTSAPLLVTGTRTGAVSDDFSNEIKLELWDLGLDQTEPQGDLSPKGSVSTDAGFNDIAWSEPDEKYPLGVIAGALENGSVDLWDAAKLRQGASDAHISRTTKHSGAVKALQWNPYRHNLLASVGAKGEIYLYDLNNMSAATRLGATVARADDIECLDWNKLEKTAHILATGSSGGFVTVWDVKQKKDILTLNNQGRKAVSAVAWDPEESTKLATATPNDQDPVIYLWSLRNSSAPERTLKGHELGVLDLSWCGQDPELLLSAGKDNRTVCWNPRTGEKLGDFAAGSNWAFQTEWNPHNPNLIASASFDGKILVTSSQSTNLKPEDQNATSQALDGEDFFAKAQTQPQGITFSLQKAPKWAARPASVSFGFGGKLVRLGQDAAKKSKVLIETFEADSSIGESATNFEDKLRSGDLAGICETKIQNAKTDEEKADWQVIATLNAGKSRKKLREYICCDEEAAELAQATEQLGVNGNPKAETNGTDDDFFGSGNDDSFLANLAATKGAKTNNPFHIYTESESEADKSITRALMLGHFEKALDICLQEDRMSDAFMIAVCGGQKCIDKAQNAYLKKKAKGPNYLRLLASIVGKNLWDVVHNADLQNWKEVMATLCTYADETEFADLCEALGDRLEEAFQEGEKINNLRKDASFCFLAGSKLEKVVNIWVEELQEQEKAALEISETDNSFSVHAKCLQDFIEKVSVFRRVTNFEDAELLSTDEWKLAPLYRLYEEYAEVLASHGQLAAAGQYLSLLPAKFGAAESAQQRIRQATSRKAGVTTTAQKQVGGVTSRGTPSVARASLPTQQSSLQPVQPLTNQTRNAPSPYSPLGGPAPAVQNPYAPAAPIAASPDAPTGYQAPQQASYGQAGPHGGYQPPQQQAPLPPPPRAGTQSPSGPPPSQQKTGDWNDMPANFFKDRQARSRAGTPGSQPIASPFANAQLNTFSPPPPPGVSALQKPTPPLPPPPKVGELPPRIMSPPAGPPQIQRPTSAAASAYAPSQLSQSAPISTLPAPQVPLVPRGASPYQPPPSTSNAAPSNRYAPAPGSQPTPAPGAGALPPPRQVAPNPYAAQQPSPYAPAASQQAPYGQQSMQVQSAPPAAAGPPPRAGPARGPLSASTPAPQPNVAPPPPRAAPPFPTTASPATSSAATPPPPLSSTKPRYPKGDRSHIQPQAQPIVDILPPAVAQIKSVAPQNFKPQVDDMEKRINILCDHLNNDDLLQSGTVQEVVEISQAIQDMDWDRATELFTAMQKRMEAEGRGEGGNWIVGVRRLIQVSKATAR